MKKTIFNLQKHQKIVTEYLETGKLEAAANAYLYAFSKTKDWKFANKAGICFQQIHMLAKAAGAFKQALKTTSNRYEVLLYIGINYSLAMDFTKAKEILIEVFQQTADYRSAYELGKIAYYQHLWDDALHYFDRCLTYQQLQNNSADNYTILKIDSITTIVFYYKAQIFGLELDQYNNACAMLNYLKGAADGKKYIFAYTKDALNRKKTKIAKFAALLLREDYKEHIAVQKLYDFLEISRS